MSAGAWRRLLAERHVPFLLVVLLCAISPALPHYMTPDATWWAIAAAILVAMVAVGWLAHRRPAQPWLGTLAPLLLFPAVGALRAADGGGMSGFTPLLFLPVVWFALYGVLAEVLLATLLAALTMVLPIVVAGAPDYPASSWRGTVLLLAVLATVGVLIHGLVESTRRASAALAMSETQFRAAFEDAPAGMALMGLDASDPMRFIRVNRALCVMLGRSPEELTGVPVTEFTHPDDVARSEQFYATATEDGPTHLEKRYLHGSGRTVWVSVSFSLIRDDSGEPLHLVAQFEDISARHETDTALLDALETERAATEKMRELDRGRVELLGTVSHDLRTPITAAVGFAELLAEGDAGPLTPEQEHMLGTVIRNLDRMALIAEDLLTLARAEGEEPSAPAAVDLALVLDGAIQSVRLQADQRAQHVTWRNNLDGALVSGDPDRLERALVNLLGNAVKFTPEDGAVDVSAAVVDGSVMVEICDTGIGVALDDQEKIFERFFRSSRARDNDIAGTGLGLAIVRAIVAQHGGTVTVRSVPGEGSTFTLTLPLLTT